MRCIALCCFSLNSFNDALGNREFMHDQPRSSLSVLHSSYTLITPDIRELRKQNSQTNNNEYKDYDQQYNPADHRIDPFLYHRYMPCGASTDNAALHCSKSQITLNIRKLLENHVSSNKGNNQEN